MSLVAKAAVCLLVLFVACTPATRDPVLVGKWFADLKNGTRATVDFKNDGNGFATYADGVKRFVWRTADSRLIVGTFNEEGEGPYDEPGSYRMERDLLTIEFDGPSPFLDGRKTVLKRVK